MSETKYVYVFISKTTTKVARCIRRLGHISYNHASISLDEDFKSVYAFARPRHSAVLLGTLVNESVDRYTLHTDDPVPVVVFKLPVSAEAYQDIAENIERIKNDKDYMYNLMSLLTFPVLRGFSTYKSFTCVEFVSYLLKDHGYLNKKPCYKYKPDDLLTELAKYIEESCDVRDLLKSGYSFSDAYFCPMSAKMRWKSVKAVFVYFKRMATLRKSNKYYA